MKKLIFIFSIGLVLFAVLAAGCLGGNDSSGNTSNNSSNNTSNNSSNNTSNNSSNNTSNNSSNNAPLLAPPITPPTNSTKFFGRVTDIQKIYGMPQVFLDNSNSQNFIFTNHSRTNFNLSDLQTHPYIEIYVDTPVIVPSSEPIPVVVANIINIVHFNGEIVNVIPSSPESFSDIQSIEVRSWNNNSSMIFHCNETLLGIDLQDIKIGTTVSVTYDERTVTVLESMPPQATAYEFYYVSVIACY
jgi:hypothetical protein